jgi:hypothetical protein
VGPLVICFLSSSSSSPLPPLYLLLHFSHTTTRGSRSWSPGPVGDGPATHRAWPSTAVEASAAAGSAPTMAVATNRGTLAQRRREREVPARGTQRKFTVARADLFLRSISENTPRIDVQMGSARWAGTNTARLNTVRERHDMICPVSVPGTARPPC